MKLTSDDIFYLNALNSITKANARDCVIQGNTIAFLVKKSELGKAIGKNALGVKKLREKLKLSVELLEYAEGPEEFIKKALYNIKIKEISFSEKNGKKTANVLLESGERRKVLGNMSRVKRIKALAKRNYGIEDIKIR
jgi:N utilization substance protein A